VSIVYFSQQQKTSVYCLFYSTTWHRVIYWLLFL